MDLTEYIRDIEDYPKAGVIFRDITPLFLHPPVIAECMDEFITRLVGIKVDKVVGIEARGFFLAPLLAQRLNAGFVPVRKKGKLPAETLMETYDLEYGQDTLEIHVDAIRPGDLVLVHDDVLATGGTAAAACRLVERLGGEVVQFNFLTEILSLKGREKLVGYPVETLQKYV